MNRAKLSKVEWDAIAGIVAAGLAIVLHWLHVVDEDTILLILLALVGLLFMNFLRYSEENRRTAEHVNDTLRKVDRIGEGIQTPDVILIGPRRLRAQNTRFLRELGGETLWFNLCLSMYRTRPLFEALLKPAIDNPSVRSIQLVLSHEQQALWQDVVKGFVESSDKHGKVKEPQWRELNSPVSYILGDNVLNGETEALLSFWGEPFMARTVEQDVPRFVLHVQSRSELLPLLEELAR